MFGKKALYFALFLIGLSQLFLFAHGIDAYYHKGEKIVYTIDPVGKAEYKDLGIVELNGRKLNLVTFRTQAFGFDDMEKIYCDPDSLLPVRVERNISMWLAKEYIVEEYDQKRFVLTITKFKNNKKVRTYIFKKDKTIHNAVFLPFYLRSIPKLDIGWSLEANFLNKFKIELVSVEEIKVPAGKFIAYHFTSVPHKFEIWISKDNPRVPLKIKGMGGLGYTLSMKKHTL